MWFSHSADAFIGFRKYSANLLRSNWLIILVHGFESFFFEAVGIIAFLGPASTKISQKFFLYFFIIWRMLLEPLLKREESNPSALFGTLDLRIVLSWAW